MTNRPTVCERGLRSGEHHVARGPRMEMHTIWGHVAHFAMREDRLEIDLGR